MLLEFNSDSTVLLDGRKNIFKIQEWVKLPQLNPSSFRWPAWLRTFTDMQLLHAYFDAIYSAMMSLGSREDVSYLSLNKRVASAGYLARIDASWQMLCRRWGQSKLEAPKGVNLKALWLRLLIRYVIANWLHSQSEGTYQAAGTAPSSLSP